MDEKHVAAQTVRRALADFRAAVYNPRQMSSEERAGLHASLDRFGLVQPVVVNDRTGNVVGGHQRLRWLMDQGATSTDVIVVDVDEDEEKALNIALNSQAISGTFTAGLEDLLEEQRAANEELFDSLRFDELAIEFTSPDMLLQSNPDLLVDRSKTRMSRGDCSTDVVILGPWVSKVDRELANRVSEAMSERWQDDNDGEGAAWVCEMVLQKLGIDP